MPPLINSVKVLIFYLIISIAACFGVVFAQTPAVPLIFFNRRLYFRWCSSALGYYLLMVTVWLLFLLLLLKINSFLKF
jgi:hypothetical protein